MKPIEGCELQIVRPFHWVSLRVVCPYLADLFYTDRQVRVDTQSVTRALIFHKSLVLQKLRKPFASLHAMCAV